MLLYHHWRTFVDGHWPPAILEDTTNIICALAIAYFAYALIYTCIHAIEHKSCKLCRNLLEVCQRLAILTIYMIASLYALEYMVLAGNPTA